jgi:hypothetical protein
VACQIGSAFAARTDHASLRSVGFFTNRALLAAISFSLLFAAVLIYLSAVHSLFNTTALSPADLATVAPHPTPPNPGRFSSGFPDSTSQGVPGARRRCRRGRVRRGTSVRAVRVCAARAQSLSVDQMGSYMFGSGPMAPTST